VSRGNRKKNNLLPLKRLLVQFTAVLNYSMLILYVPGSQTTLCALNMCTDPDFSLLEDSFVLRLAGAYKVIAYEDKLNILKLTSLETR